MKTRFFNYLRFSRTERNGTLALIIIAAVFFAIPEITRWLRPQNSTDLTPFQAEIQAFRQEMANTENPSDGVGDLFAFDPNTASVADFVQLGLSEKVSNTICNYREKGGKFREPTDFQKIWSLKKEDYERLLPYIRIESAGQRPTEKRPEKPQPELFTFDPNTASEADFLRLGLPPSTIKSILNYRAKGGQFRKKEDLEKIYTLRDDDYARIAPYANFSETNASADAPRPATYAGGTAAPARQFAAKGPVDINRASMEDWATLPGIGESRARQLVNFREKLGGFLSVEQVGEMYGLPDSVFQRIKPSLVMSSAEPRKINLNAASVADLDAHPYISKKQAQLIIAYREQHGAFAAPQDLGKMLAFSDKIWLTKVIPYLSAN
ncbi:MAG: helix-hairpin-helix domain-containing protein [Saprospiraceae bacterium]